MKEDLLQDSINMQVKLHARRHKLLFWDLKMHIILDYFIKKIITISVNVGHTFM